MKVQMKSLMAGPDGVHQPGEVVDVEEKTARELIASGAAIGVAAKPKAEKPVEVAPQPERKEPAPKIVLPQPVIETAAIVPPENAAGPVPVVNPEPTSEEKQVNG